MSALTEALKTIDNWMQTYRPQFSSLLQAGLKTEEIDEKTQDFPFQLSEDLYELYRWHNGTSGNGLELNEVEFFPCFIYISLEESIEKYKEFVKIENKIKNYKNNKDSFNKTSDFTEWSPFWIPIFNNDGQFYFAIFNKGSSDNVPIGLYDPEWTEPIIEYDNLTTMMLTISECYQTEAYYLDKEGWLEEDETRVIEIKKKYNSLSQNL